MFQEKNKPTFQIIVACMGSPESKWKCIHTIGDLAERITKFKNRPTVIAAIRHVSEDKDSLMMLSGTKLLAY